MNRSVILWRIASFAVAAGFVALWQSIANLKLVSPVYLPGPDRAWAALVRGFSNGDLWSKLAGTLEHMAYGWLAASIAGIALGAIIGSSRTMRTYVAPSLEFLRPLPVSAISPVAIAMLGLTQAILTLGRYYIEERSWLYLLRLAAFLLILLALWLQNRRGRTP